MLSLLSDLVCVVTGQADLVAVVIGRDSISVADCREAASLVEMHVGCEMDRDEDVKVVVVLARRDANGSGMLRNLKMSQLAKSLMEGERCRRRKSRRGSQER
jgi:hypothetical protein